MTKKILISILGFIIVLVIIAGIRLGLLLHSIRSYRVHWQKEAAKTPEQGSLTYLALGDSTAQGIGASSPWRGYVGLLAEFMGKKTGKPMHVINVSVSGAKINDLIKNQLPILGSIAKPDFITIEIGANDMRTYNEDKFRAEFSEVLKALPDGTYVTNMPSFKGGRAGRLTTNAVAASSLISKLIADYPKLHLVDVQATTNTQNLHDFGADLFHPSNSGYKNWELAFIRAMGDVSSSL